MSYPYYVQRALEEAERAERPDNDRNAIGEAIEAEAARRRTVSWRPGPGPDTIENVREHMSAALAYRLGAPEPTDLATLLYTGRSFHGLVEDLLRLRHVTWDGRLDLLSRGIVTGDVPALLTGAGNRILREHFQAAAGGIMLAAKRRRVRDFRDVKSIQVDGDLAFRELSEAGEFQSGSVAASAETYSISVFGRTFGLSRALLLDDDLGAFQDLSEQLARMATEFVSAKLVARLEAGTLMSDGLATFVAGHFNLGTAGALSETTLAELIKLVRAAKGLANEPIACIPRVLLVPSALEFTARKLVWLLGSPPPLEVAVEPRLTSATAFFVFATDLDGLQYAIPNADGPTIEVASRPGYIGLQAKAKLDLGVGIVGFQPMAKNVGA